LVYTIQRFRVSRSPFDTPISIGEYDSGGGNAPVLPNPSYGYNPNYPYGPINFPIPSTGSHPGTIDEIPSTTCPTGQAPNSQGICTPINQLPACQAGYARDTTTGACVPVPLGTGQGNITQVQVPTSTLVGANGIIKTWFTNTSGQTLSYKVKVTITGLGITMESPSLSLTNGQSGNIEISITVPSSATAGSYSGLVELKAVSQAGLLYLQDSESFTLIVTSTGTGTGTCPTGDITFSVTKRGTRSYEIRWSNSGFKQGETVGLWYLDNAKTDWNQRFTTDTDKVEGSTDSETVTVPSGITCVKVALYGYISKKTRIGYFKPT